MKVTVLYNVTESLAYGAPQDLQTTELKRDAIIIAEALKKQGFKTELFEVKEANYRELLNRKTDVFFNLCYGIGSLANSEHLVPELLDKTRIPYTGSSAKAMLITTDKGKTKRLFMKYKIPTPKFQVVKKNNVVFKNLKFPLVVKPLKEDSSCGISQTSVVTNEKDLRKKVSEITRLYKNPCLVEEYIAGRELRVSVLGSGKKAKVLPITEISFLRSYKKAWKIVDFAAKWDRKADKDTPAGEAKLNQKIYQRIKQLALKAYLLCCCQDYGDIDIRLGKDNIPYFLEVNCNPGIAPSDGTERLAKRIGLTYGGYLKEIVLSALWRRQN